MNFAAARQMIGQKDDKGWDKKVSMLATFGEGTGQVTFNMKQKQECKCKLTDDAGETHNVILRGNTMPDAQWLGRRGSFLISAYQGTYEGKPYTGYSGFWNNNAQVNQAPVSQVPPATQPPANEPYHVPVGQPGLYNGPAGPEPPRQSPPSPAQAPNAPRVAVDPTRNSIESQTALKAATDLAVGRADLVPDMAKFYDIVGANKTWLQTGTVPPNVLSSPMPTGPANWDQGPAPTDPHDETQRPAEPPVSDDDIPF